MNFLRWVYLLFKRFFLWLFEDIIEIWSQPKPLLPEDKIPRHQGKPDLSYYTEPLQHYIDLYNSFLNASAKRLNRHEQALAWKQRVHGTWGLLAKGQESLPYLLTLVGHSNPDAREDATFLLGQLNSNPEVAQQLLISLQGEPDLVVKSSIIGALGKLRYQPAVPALASLILDHGVDVDTKWNAADSLGLIVRQDFSGRDKLQKAAAWLRAHPEMVRQN